MRYLLLISLLGLLLTSCQKASSTPSSSPAPAKAVTTVTPAQPEIHTGGAPRMTLAEAKAEFDKGDAIFIDSRLMETYKELHVKGSMNISLSDDPSKYSQIPKGKKIIVYCACNAEQTSNVLISKLKEKGIVNAFAMVGGYKDWKDAGYPMEGQKK